MQSIKSKNTIPEQKLKLELKAAGYKFRTQYGKERIDIAFPLKKIAIFVDGCFWHQCPKHSHLPKSNKLYWLPKLQKNIQRSKAKDARLRKAGWKIIHVWEHDIKNNLKMLNPNS